MKTFLLLVLIISSASVSAENYLICSYKNGTKQIKISDTGKIQKHEEKLPSGIKELIVINDPWTLNDFDNYIVLTKGEHTITYSLDCKKIYSKESK